MEQPGKRNIFLVDHDEWERSRLQCGHFCATLLHECDESMNATGGVAEGGWERDIDRRVE
jgi:hypothetical protein